VSAPEAAAALDLADPRFIADPHPVFHEMRSEAPVCRLPDRDAWAVTSYEHVRALMRDPRVAPMLEPGERPQSPPLPEAGGEHPFFRAREESRRLFARAFHARAPADHKRLRRLLRPPFAPARVAARRARIEGIVDELTANAAARGRMDVVGELARPLALTTAGELIGIPEPQRRHFAAGVRELVPHLDVNRTAVARERGLLAMIELASRMRTIVPAPGSSPEGEATLLGLLARAYARGEVTEEDVIANGVFLFFASYMTTQHLVGNAVLSLVRNPDQWERLRSRPDMTTTAVDELLRYETSVPATQRHAREDIEIAGATIPRGGLIVLFIGAAHRDPAVFADPDRLDLTRSPNPHFGFGHGVHYCLGAALGRLVAEVAVRTMVERIGIPRLDSDHLEWEPTFIVRGLKALPLAFEATR
jgi:pimeloyl-[acyl-carrier protein] synthase